jgi:hypothetical protein
VFEVFDPGGEALAQRQPVIAIGLVHRAQPPKSCAIRRSVAA